MLYWKISQYVYFQYTVHNWSTNLKLTLVIELACRLIGGENWSLYAYVYLWLLLIWLLAEILRSFKDSSNVFYTQKNFHRKDKPKIFFHNGYFRINSTSRLLWCQYFPQTIHNSFSEGWPLLTYNETQRLHVPWGNKHVEIKSCTRNSLKLFVSNIKLKTSIACVQ